jgi:hypothetical protein
MALGRMVDVGVIEDHDIESQPVSMKALPGCQKIIDMG